jgi:hypothetical protein
VTAQDPKGVRHQEEKEEFRERIRRKNQIKPGQERSRP